MSSVKRLDLLNMLLVLGIVLDTVVAVPSSVLVQNSEVTSNINAANNNHNMMSKVKRSSNNANEMMPKDTPTDGESSSANKKSSPEVLPPAFNVPVGPQEYTSNTNYGNGNKINGKTNSNSFTDSQLSGMPSNEDIINSAIAAGLTAAAVEAAATVSQRDLEQQEEQLKQQALLYGDDETPTLLHKRGISNQQYLYGGMGLGGAYGYGNANGNGYGSGSASNSGNNIYTTGEYYNNPYLNNALTAGSAVVPNGVWADEMDPSVVYTDVQDDDYLNVPRASSYRNKAYDNLQSTLNAEAYPESMALPLSQQPQYMSRYYGAINGNKRSNRFDINSGGAMANNNNRYADMRLKRDTKLTPADMLALVALVEAGERARQDSEAETNNNNYMYPTAGMNAPAPAPGAYNNYNGIKTFYPTSQNAQNYDYPTSADEVEENGAGSWLEPNMVDYYGLPMNVETLPKYELPREHKYGAHLGGANGNRFGLKRFMVAKKKRSMGSFLNEPVAKSSISYIGNGEKFY
ncbi:uncharacterized protein [Eurosta solidaginis]|uniref:uncharacterized protein n=1 Tax=Eurosta solidaginis TaxID=178769 RepID=UPI0035309427